MVASQSPVRHPSRYPAQRGGFTLVELLVVIGIIALLISILLPALSKARESTARAACLSNTRQIAAAFIAYTNDNRGSFPFMALAGGSPWEEDWIWWQKTNKRINDIAFHGIGPYLGLNKNPKVMYCPSDVKEYRVRTNGGDPYPFSYVLNNLYTSSWINNQPAKGIMHGGGSWGNVGGHEDQTIAAKLTQVRQSSDKILIFEEDERTIDDGNGSNYCSAGNLGTINLLAIHHDELHRKLKDVPSGSSIPNPEGKGMCGFCDGHADYIVRWTPDGHGAHGKWNNIPDPDKVPTAAFNSWP